MKMNFEYKKERKTDIRKAQVQLEVKILQQRLQNILEEQIQRNTRYYAQNFFEGADKPGKLLAALLKKEGPKHLLFI